ncbi:MAG: DUF2807 domain-containing protein [bacterium]|nr:DUF2807 domain-containing protein [bacterium]
MQKTNWGKSSLMMLTVILGLLTLVGCYNRNCIEGEGTVGSGNEIRESRSFPAFEGVEIRSACQVFIRQGGEQSVVLEGEDNILPLVDTYIESGILVIDSSHSYRSRSDLKAYITLTDIRKLAISGAGFIYGEEPINADDLILDSTGAGKVELDVTSQSISTRITGAGSVILSGTTSEHLVEITGAGNVEAANLQAAVYDILIAGAGNCNVYVTQRLEATITGSGSIFYSGNPATVNARVTGSGTIVQQ